MKTPVCDSDVKAGQLCESCKRRLAEGKITQLDFEVAKILYGINERYNISAASFSKALDLGRVVLILTEGEVGILIGKQGKVVLELSEALGKKVRIAEMQGDVKKTIADIVAPVRLLGVNKIFHEGRELTKVRLAKSDMAQLPIDIPSLESALCSLLEEKVAIAFE
ncbi:MAG: KH domain-containing protein [Candidatus Micrarchaeota archaeon]|nr:KH domain-containing protein [Candidatus Micrarchaeota archaeon]